jgi:hypothetical protein
MTRRSATSAPPTLAFLARDVDAISAHCLTCGYKRELPLAPLLERHGETPFPVFARSGPFPSFRATRRLGICGR